MIPRFLNIALVLVVVVGESTARILPPVHPNEVAHDKWVRSTDPREYRKVLLDRMVRMLDTRYSPCDDFYEYACGNYDRVMPNFNQRAMSPFDELNQYSKMAIERLIKSEVTYNSTESEVKLKRFYASCMNSQHTIQHADEYVKSLGSWPAFDPYWSPYQFNWIKAGVDLALAEIPALFSLSMGLTGQHNETLGVVLSVPMSLGFDVKNARSELRDLFQHSSVPVSYVEDMIRRLPGFITEFDELITTATEDQSIQDTVYRLQSQLPACDLSSILSETTGHTVDPHSLITVANVDFLNNFCKLVKNTDLRTIADFLFYVSYMEATTNIEKYVGYDSEQLEEYCVSETKSLMIPAVAGMYIREYFSPESKRQVTEMVKGLHRIGRQLLMETRWLDEQSMSRAIRKMEEAKPFVAYPDFMGSETELRKYYANLTMDSRNFMTTRRLLKIKGNRESMELQGKSSALLPFDPIEMNPHFTRYGKGALHLSVTFFQPPAFHKFNPSFVNYGAAMAVAGHEFMHNFDYEGAQFDERGRKESFLSENLALTYLFRAECFYSQFNEFKLKGSDLHVKGALTLSENVADGDGLKMAYRLFKEWMDRHPDVVEQEAIDFAPLQLTHDQAFFLSNAQFWCDVRTRELREHQLATDEHAPEKFRVLGSAANSEEFARAFQCPPHFRLNPQEKCHNFFD